MANPTVTVEIRSIGSKKVIDTLGKVRTAAKGVTKGVDKLGKATKKASTKLTGFKGKMTELGKSASLALGPLNGVAARLTAFSGLATGASFRVAGFIGALVGAGGLVFAAIKVANSLDEMRKAAERTGLSIERFQEFQFVASQAGISAEKFSKAMETFTKRLGEAKREEGAARTALKFLLGSLEEIKGIDTEETLLRVADAFQGLEGTVSGAAISANLFSKANQRMTKFLNQGRKGIEEMSKKARELGIIMERDIVLNATKAADSLDAMGKVIKINLSRVVVQLLPLITKLAIVIGRLGPVIQENLGKVTIGLFASIGGLIGLIGGLPGAAIGLGVGGFFGAMISGAEGAIDVLKSLRKTISETFGAGKDLALGFVDSLIGFAKIFTVTEEQMAAMQKAAEAFFKNIEEKGAKKILGDFLRDTDALRRSFELLVEFGDAGGAMLVKTFRDSTKFLNQFDLATQRALATFLEIPFERLEETIDKLFLARAGRNQLKQIFEDTRTPAEQLALALDKIDVAANSASASMDLIDRATSRAMRNFIDADVGMQLVVRSFESAGDGMVDAMTTAGDAMEVLRDTARSIVDDILKTFIRLAVVNQILNAIFGLTGGAAFPTINFGGGGGGGVGSGGGGRPRTLAHGGSFRVGGFGGPDSQLVPIRATPGELITATPQGKAGPEGNIVINMNISTGVAATVRSEVLKLAPVIKSLVRRDIAEASRQGGRFNRALNS